MAEAVAEIRDLASWMKLRGENDHTFAPKLGISRVHVSRLRRKVNRPRPELAQKIEELTGIPAWELVRPDAG